MNFVSSKRLAERYFWHNYLNIVHSGYVSDFDLSDIPHCSMSAVHKSASPGQGDTLFRQIVDCRRGGAGRQGGGGEVRVSYWRMTCH